MSCILSEKPPLMKLVHSILAVGGLHQENIT